MFGTIRKHQQWLWLVIITLTIISFVIFFSPYSKMQDSRGMGDYGSINGQKVTEAAYVKAQREAYLHYFLMNGRWPDENAKSMGFDPMRETYQWLLMIQKQEQLGIYIDPDVVAQRARDMLQPLERAGLSSPATFIQQVLQPRGFSADDLERFVKHFVGLQELMATEGLSGSLVTPQEARSLYEREHQELSTEAVLFSASNYLASVTITPESIAQFYSNSLAMYRVPDQVQVAYVQFSVSNFLAGAESQLAKSNLTELIDANFSRIASNYTNFIPTAKTPEEAKAKIKEEIVRSRALADARRAAADFARPLFEQEPLKAENLAKVAKEKGLTVAVTAPFDRSSEPAGLQVGADFGKQAFARTPEDPFAGPIVGSDAVYVIALDKKIPSQIPPLDQIRAKVTEDYKLRQAIQLAVQNGLTFHTTLTNEMAKGKTFEAACKDSNVTPLQVPPFSLSTRTLPGDLDEKVNINQLKQLAFSTEPGKASAFQSTGLGGIVVYVKSKLPIDESKVTADLPRFISSVRQTRTQEAFNEWFRKEAEKGLRFTPLGQPKPPPTMSSGTAKS